MDAVCLKRSKTDKKPEGSLLVELPKKTIIIRDVELTEEERLCYAVFHKQVAEVVAKYARRGQLLRNYAHIFVMMMRLRQMCCHRSGSYFLLPTSYFLFPTSNFLLLPTPGS
jgi:SNF2 family DNA or RNA helicase